MVQHFYLNRITLILRLFCLGDRDRTCIFPLPRRHGVPACRHTQICNMYCPIDGNRTRFISAWQADVHKPTDSDRIFWAQGRIRTPDHNLCICNCFDYIIRLVPFTLPWTQRESWLLSPLAYSRIYFVPTLGLEPRSLTLRGCCIAKSAKWACVPRRGLEPLSEGLEGHHLSCWTTAAYVCGPRSVTIRLLRDFTPALHHFSYGTIGITDTFFTNTFNPWRSTTNTLCAEA